MTEAERNEIQQIIDTALDEIETLSNPSKRMNRVGQLIEIVTANKFKLAKETE